MKIPARPLRLEPTGGDFHQAEIIVTDLFFACLMYDGTKVMTWIPCRSAGDDVSKKQSISEEALAAEYEAVYRYTLSLCGDDAAAQDITQETFLRAMKSATQFRGNSSLYTWLCAIAKNHWLNRCRIASREMSFDDSAFHETGGDVSLEEKVIEKDTAMQIHMILHNIQEPYKEVFSLRIFGQLSFQEIAHLFGKTESWARVTHHRARKMIHDKLRRSDLNG